MGDPFMDFDTVVKILFFVVVFGGWILSTIFKNLIKPAARRPPGHEGGAPARGLREFLEEIRQEEAGGDRAAAPAPRVERAEEIVWEEVEDVEEIDEAPRPAARQGELTAFDARREQWKRETERRRAERERQRQERARRRQEELEPQRAAEEPRQEWTRVAERHLDSKLDEREIGSHLDDRQVLSQLADRRLGALAGSGAASTARRLRSPELIGALRGLTVKDLILADVILGKPRSKRRHFREL